MDDLLVADLSAVEFQSKMDWVTNIIETALTEKQRIAVLSFLDGKTYRDIGSILNISVRAAWELVHGNKNHQGGAIRKIKKQLR
jgi:DNA-directed RNA polymerase specialized sigma24 family protein